MNIKELKPLLEEIVGAENVSYNPMCLVVYSRDYGSLSVQKTNIVVLPGCMEEVSRIIRLANRTNTPVTVCGGAATAALCTSKEGIVLDLRGTGYFAKTQT